MLDLLEVPYETNLQDFLLSNLYLQREIDRKSLLIWLGSLFRISRDEARDLLGVKPEYLESARSSVIDKFGSREAYWRNGLGVSDETIDRLRQVLLEDGENARAERAPE